MSVSTGRALITLVLFFTVIGCGPAQHDTPSAVIPNSQQKLTSQFQSIHQLIITPLCLKCHSGEDAPHGIDLSSYESIINAGVFPPLIIPGEPSKSSLYKSVENGSMPKKKRRLTFEELEAIRSWIQNGARKDDSPVTEPDPDDPPDEPAPTKPCPDDEPCD